MEKRQLTINFQRSINSGKPQVMEVAIAPLTDPSAPNDNATLVGGTQTQDVVLGNENNPVTFMLVPTDHPDLTERVTYRAAWREKYMGRQISTDFVMPDFDTDFDDLQNLGNIIGGETYVQWTDRSRPGGVAGLNDGGQVIDADGNIVSGADAASAVQGHLDAEVVARLDSERVIRTTFQADLNEQIAQVYASTINARALAVNALENADLIEKTARQNAVNDLNTLLAALEDDTNAQIATINEHLDDVDDTLDLKADLVAGKVPSSQLPSIALGHAVSVADEAAMLALTSDQVQPGDFAVRPDSIWFLNASPPSTLGNWVQFQVAATVTSVNGHTGAVVLSASDVGARSSSTPVAQADVSGLTAALAAKTDTSTTTALTGRVSAIENDSTIVKTSGGLINRSLMPNDVAFVNNSNLVTKKDGTVLNLGSGGTLDIADVTGLQAALDAKLNGNDASVTNARTPTAHHTSHATAGSDPIAPADIGAASATHTHTTSDITGLAAIISNNTLTSSSQHGTRISSLETRVEDLELGGGGGGGSGASGKTVWYSDVAVTGDFSTMELHSPYGYNPSHPSANVDGYYYDPAGADPADAVWPYFTPNGHLKFIQRNESAPADTPYAFQDSLDTLSDLVDTKAAQADLDTANAAIATKASLAALSSLSATVDTKADQADLDTTDATVATKASQAALDSLTTTVGTKAAQSSLDTTNATVATKAAQSDLTALTTRVTNVETGKADLTSGTVPLTQLPAYPTSKVTNLDTILAAKADLSGGVLATGQIPNIAINKITNLQANLDAKADLVAGKIPSAQIPSIALQTVVTVANQGAMLALTSGQVQQGDVCVITATADKGSYILNASDPSQLSNWVKLTVPDDVVQSVNGLTGTVVLDATAVGARSSAVSVPQADVTGLVTALAGKADTSALTSGLAGKTSPTDVQTQMSDAVANKQLVDYVATANVLSLSGQQTADGTLAPLGARVLLTAQTSSVNNGIWIVNTGAWTRPTDMPAGSYLMKGTVVMVSSGATNLNTFWQQTNNSGVVGTNANNWSKVMTAGQPPTFTASLGVQRVSNDFRAQTVTGGGVSAVSGGLKVDRNVVPNLFAGDVPSGSTVATITHNLGTTDVIAHFRDKAAGDAVLVGWKPTGVNTISAEFENAPTAGQYRVVIHG